MGNALSLYICISTQYTASSSLNRTSMRILFSNGSVPITCSPERAMISLIFLPVIFSVRALAISGNVVITAPNMKSSVNFN